MIADLCSIVIPVYSRADELLEAIRSIAEQTYRPFEIIVVDDGSVPPLIPARYEKLCSEFDVSLRWIALPSNQGPSAARNRGLKAARGEFVTFLDSDDFMLPQKLHEQIGLLRQDTEAVAVMCGYVTSTDSSQPAKWSDTHLPEGEISLGRLLSFDRSLKVTGPGVLYRTAAVRQVGGYDSALHAVEDFDLLVRIVEKGGKIRTLRKALLRVDVSSGRQHLSENLEKQEMGRVEFLKKHGALLSKVPKARIENLLCLGIVRFRSGAARNAIPDFLQVIRLNPLNFRAWIYLFCCGAPALYPLIVRTVKAAHTTARSSGQRTPLVSPPER